jgi:hypothetical protein
MTRAAGAQEIRGRRAGRRRNARQATLLLHLRRSRFGFATFVDQALNFLGFDQHPAPDPNGANLALPHVGSDCPWAQAPNICSFFNRLYRFHYSLPFNRQNVLPESTCFAIICALRGTCNDTAT